MTPWDSDDALTLLLLFLGPEAVCSVRSVSPRWKLRASDNSLWALLVPGAHLVAGAESLSRTVCNIRDGTRLAVSELGGLKGAAVDFIDLYGDILVLCEETAATPGQAIEVYDLKSRRKRRYEAAISNATALRILEGDSNYLVVASASRRPLIFIDFRASDPNVTPLALVIDGLTADDPIRCLSRAGKGRMIGAQVHGPCFIWLFGEEDGSLAFLARLALSLEPAGMTFCSDAVWESDTDAVRTVLAVLLPQGVVSLCHVVDWAHEVGVCDGFCVGGSSNCTESAASVADANILATNTAPAESRSSRQDSMEGLPSGEAHSPESDWSEVSTAPSDVLTQQSVALALEFTTNSTPQAKAAWISRPLPLLSPDAPMRCSSLGSVFVAISYAFSKSGANDAIAIAEINGLTGEVCRTYELPQLKFEFLANWQWLGPLLAIVDPRDAAMHIFSFEFSSEADGLSAYEGFRVVSSLGSCAPPLRQQSAPIVNKGLGTCHVNCTGSGRLGESLSVLNQNTGTADCTISGLWLVLGTCKGEPYRYHLRLFHKDGKLSGGGHDMSLEGTATLGSDHSWQLRFRQVDEGSDYSCDCEATVLATNSSSERMKGSWVDSMGQTGSFAAAKDMSGLKGARADAEVKTSRLQQWATSGNRFAYLPSSHWANTEANTEANMAARCPGAFLCEWSQPFACGP